MENTCLHSRSPVPLSSLSSWRPLIFLCCIMYHLPSFPHYHQYMLTPLCTWSNIWYSCVLTYGSDKYAVEYDVCSFSSHGAFTIEDGMVPLAVLYPRTSPMNVIYWPVSSVLSIIPSATSLIEDTATSPPSRNVSLCNTCIRVCVAIARIIIPYLLLRPPFWSRFSIY